MSHEGSNPSLSINSVSIRAASQYMVMSFSHNLRRSDLRSNYIEIGLDDRGNSTIVRIESPSGDIMHTYDPKTHIAKTYSQIGTPHPACMIRCSWNQIQWECETTWLCTSMYLRVSLNPKSKFHIAVLEGYISHLIFVMGGVTPLHSHSSHITQFV